MYQCGDADMGINNQRITKGEHMNAVEKADRMLKDVVFGIVVIAVIMFAVNCFADTKENELIIRRHNLQTEELAVDLPSINSPQNVIFFGKTTSDEILRIELGTGNIYYNGKLITTDKELVEGFRHVIEANRCSKCGGAK